MGVFKIRHSGCGFGAIQLKDSTMPRQRLAVFTPQVGSWSETFIRRHTNDLAPGQTVAVTYAVDGSAWTLTCDRLILSDIPRWKPDRLIPSLMRRLGKEMPMAKSRVRDYLLDKQATVIMAEYLDFAMKWLPLAQDMGLRFFAHGHGYDFSHCLTLPKWRSAYLRLNDSQGIIVPSHYAKNRLVDMGLLENKILVVPYGTDVPPSTPFRDISDIIRCLAVGRFVQKKGPMLTLKALRIATGAVKNLRFDYIGDGPLLESAKDFCRKTGLNGRVTLHGPQPHHVVQEFMRRSDIFIQHSVRDPESGDEEGLPVAILEAMAHGLPVIATRHAGIPEAVQDGITGLLVEERDYSAMADHLIMLSRQTDIRVQMGQSGWERARRLFSWEHEREELRRIFAL